MNLLEHWDAIYRKQGPEGVSWYEAEPSTLDLVEAASPAADAWILDVGGGVSGLTGHLLERGFTRLAVADASRAALDLARSRLGASANAVLWLHQDVRELRLDFQVELWHDRAVFHFLTAAEDRARYRERLLAALRPGGHAVLATFALDGPTRCSSLDVVRYDAASLAEALGPDLELLRARPHTHVTPGNRDQRFLQALFRRRRRPSGSASEGPDDPA